MLTSNFINLLFGFMIKSSSSVRYLSGNTGERPFSIDSGKWNDPMSLLFAPFADDSKSVYTTLSSASYGFLFGTGNILPAFDDYKLSGDIIPTVSIDSNIVTTNVTGAENTYTQRLTIRNTGDEEITIKEVGRATNTYASATYNSILIERTVLDSSLTLAPGESGVIFLTLNLPVAQV